MEGRWPAALERLDEAERLAAGVSSWPGHASARMVMTVMSLNVRFWMGRAGDALRMAPDAIRHSEERGHLVSWAWLRMTEGWALACCGRTDEALQASEEMGRRLPVRGFELPNWYLEHMKVQLQVEIGDTERAWEMLVAVRKKTRFEPASQPQRICGLWIAAAAVIGRAARNPAERKRMLAAARRFCAGIDRQRAPWGAGVVLGLRAGIASVEGDDEEALRLLGEAEPLLVAHSLELAAAAAHDVRGRLLGGDSGRQLQQRAGEWIRAQGVSRASLWAHLPGSWEP